MTYHQKITFSVFKWYIRVFGASTNPENMKKNNPENYFSTLFFLQPMCVFNINFVFDNLSAIRHEREFSTQYLVLTHMPCESHFLCVCFGCVRSENPIHLILHIKMGTAICKFDGSCFRSHFLLAIFSCTKPLPLLLDKLVS